MKKLTFLALAALAVGAACSEARRDLTTPTSQAPTSPVVSQPRFDDISNNLDGSIDAVAEVMPLNVGGSNGTTYLYVAPTNTDGKTGCNFHGNDDALVLAVSSSDPSVATVSPSEITLHHCETSATGPALTVHPLSAGSTTISLSVVSTTMTATFNVAPATFTVTVAPPPNTPPQVSITGVTGGASYEIGSVPAATCDVTDAEDGNSSVAVTLSAITGPLAAYGLGEQTASCSYTDAGGLTASASVTYGIVDTTAPVITLTLKTPANSNGWNNSDVTVSWSCTDAGSGVVSETVSQTLSTDGASQSATGTCEDHAGNTASDTQTGIKIDKTKPTASASASPAANANEWNNTSVTVSYSGTDGLSGIDYCDGNDVLTSEGAGQVASGTCTDKAGNVSVAATKTINIDETTPTAKASALPVANANGWNNTNVTVSFSGADELSGVDFCSAATTLTNEGASQSASGTCTDKAGNVSTLASKTVNIDKTAPSVSLVGGPADGGSYYFGFVPAAPTCSASDALSDLDGACDVSGYSSAVGPQTVTASATDKAGNSASVSASYTVLSWTPNGFFQPVDMTPAGLTTVWNTVKAGSTVPLKFEIFAGPTELTSTSYVSQPLSAVGVACGTGTADDIELTATGATSLRYDATAGQFIYNWQTPRTSGACYKVTVSMIDGSSITAYFKLK